MEERALVELPGEERGGSGVERRGLAERGVMVGGRSRLAAAGAAAAAGCWAATGASAAAGFAAAAAGAGAGAAAGAAAAAGAGAAATVSMTVQNACECER